MSSSARVQGRAVQYTGSKRLFQTWYGMLTGGVTLGCSFRSLHSVSLAQQLVRPTSHSFTSELALLLPTGQLELRSRKAAPTQLQLFRLQLTKADIGAGGRTWSPPWGRSSGGAGPSPTPTATPRPSGPPPGWRAPPRDQAERAGLVRTGCCPPTPSPPHTLMAEWRSDIATGTLGARPSRSLCGRC